MKIKFFFQPGRGVDSKHTHTVWPDYYCPRVYIIYPDSSVCKYVTNEPDMGNAIEYIIGDSIIHFIVGVDRRQTPSRSNSLARLRLQRLALGLPKLQYMGEL